MEKNSMEVQDMSQYGHPELTMQATGLIVHLLDNRMSSQLGWIYPDFQVDEGTGGLNVTVGKY